MARREKKFHFIYKTTNKITGRYYIGMHSTDNPNDGYMGSGKRLKRSLNKYGKENHIIEFLEFVSTREELCLREREIVNLDEVAKKDCMNLMIGGKGGFISEEQQRRRSKSANLALNKKLKNDINFRKKFGEKISKALSGDKNPRYGKPGIKGFEDKRHTAETIKRMKESRRGTGLKEKNSQYNTCWITKNGINKKIKKDILEAFIKDEWKMGRVVKK